MPAYDYLCETNGRTVEVRHRMSEQLRTWGDLCDLVGLDPGRTPRTAPVRKLIGGAAVIGATSLGSGPAPAPCEAGQVCCGGGACGALN